MRTKPIYGTGSWQEVERWQAAHDDLRAVGHPDYQRATHVAQLLKFSSGISAVPNRLRPGKTGNSETRTTRPGVLWCANKSHGNGRRGDGWAFPRAVNQLLRAETANGPVLHLFGGKAGWGIRLDVDAALRPDVVGDSWLPPFADGSFDHVILDPAYFRINTQEADALLAGAARIARKRVWWFHVVWLARRSYLRPLRSWLVRVGDFCQCRCLQEFEPICGRLEQRGRQRYFRRGPAIKYNRWLAGQRPLPLFGAGGPA